MFQSLEGNDILGPTYDITLFPEIAINSNLSSKFDFYQPCCYNYNISDIVQDLRGPIGISLSYSQYSDNESLSQSNIEMS